jgi:hypothetical protein
LLPKRSSVGPRLKVASNPKKASDFLYPGHRLPYYQLSPEQKFAQKFITGSFQKGEKLLNLDLKQIQANRRRKLYQSYQKNLVQSRNRAQHVKMKKIQQEKWKKNCKLERKSWEMKNDSEEIVTLHKVRQSFMVMTNFLR